MFKVDKSNPYNILEIPNNSDQKTIREAYKTLALKYHPDRHPEKDKIENTIRFQEISDAYEKLSNKSYENGKITLTDIFKDLYSDLFSTTNKNNLSIYKEIELTLEDIYKGKDVFLSYQRQCPKDEICYECKGIGKIIDYNNNNQNCINCNGVGKSNELLIESCTMQICIEPGFSKKSLFYDKKGHIDVYGNIGELVINIIYKSHKIYKQKDNDLFTVFKLTFKECMLGTTKTIKYINGEEIEIPIDGPVKQNRMLKINKKGINKNGSLYIKLKIDIPTILTKEQKEAIEKYF